MPLPEPVLTYVPSEHHELHLIMIGLTYIEINGTIFRKIICYVLVNLCRANYFKFVDFRLLRYKSKWHVGKLGAFLNSIYFNDNIIHIHPYYTKSMYVKQLSSQFDADDKNTSTTEYPLLSSPFSHESSIFTAYLHRQRGQGLTDIPTIQYLAVNVTRASRSSEPNKNCVFQLCGCRSLAMKYRSYIICCSVWSYGTDFH